MAGSEVNLYGVGDVDLTALMNTVDSQRVNYHGLSLTNYDNTSLPAIAAGSFCEVGGALFKFTAEEAISGWGVIGNDTDVYIKLVPAGTIPDTVTALFTDTAPTWSDAKQGWYGTVAATNHRYVGGLYKDTGGNYTKKYLYHYIDTSIKSIKIYGDGAVEISGGLTAAALWDDAVTDAKIDKSFTGGNATVASGSTWTPSTGIYNVVRTAGSGSLATELYVSGAWRTQDANKQGSWFFITDGTNVRLKETIGSSVTIYYLKLD